jgi:hypothetical protein
VSGAIANSQEVRRQWWLPPAILGQFAAIGLVLLLCTSCVQYHLSLKFNWWSGGLLTQYLAWEPTALDLAGELREEVTRQLLQEFESRAKAAGGTAEYLSDSELQVEIPFDNYSQLDEKVDRFLNEPIVVLSSAEELPTGENWAGMVASTAPILPVTTLQADTRVESDFQLERQQFWICDRYDLAYDLDLTELRIPISNGFLTFSADRLIDLQFTLKTPLKASRSNATNRTGNQLTWQLKTGRINRLEASFWLPSPLGMGLTLAATLVAAIAVWWRMN